MRDACHERTRLAGARPCNYQGRRLGACRFALPVEHEVAKLVREGKVANRFGDAITQENDVLARLQPSERAGATGFRVKREDDKAKLRRQVIHWDRMHFWHI